ncbi:MAG: GumC family protein [Steroidobacteraceae bacterium]
MLKRRWKLAAGVGGLIFFGFAVYAFTRTAVYEATAIIQIERPLIPNTMVQTTVASYAEELLASVTQRVLTTENITSVIERLKLYSSARSSVPMDDLVLEFRENTSVTPSTVDTPTRYGRPSAVTYAFTVAFRYYDAEKSAEVANELARLHVAENSALRAGSAARTSAFLQAESDKVAKRIAEVQGKILALQGQVGGVLAAQDPMMAAQRYEQIDRELASVDTSLRAARERKDILESEALQTSRYRAIMADGQTIVRGEDRLIAAQQELVAAQAKYSQSHPDVVRLKREIAALTGGAPNSGVLASQLRSSVAATEEQLAAARQTYSEDHPDVVRLQKTLESQKQQLADAESRATTPAAQPPADNPVYLQLQTRIRTADVEISELSSRRAELYGRLHQYSYNPELEAKYGPLARERDLLQEQYTDMREKYTQATLAESVESEDKGQILTLVEPARTPSLPIEPNRLMLIFLGFVLGLAAAFSTASLSDALDGSVRGSRDIETLLHMTPIALIPFIDSPGDVVQRRKRTIFAALIALTAIALIVVIAT